VIKFGNPNRDYQSKARRRVVCRSQSSAVRALILAPRRLDQPITTRVMIALWLAFKLGWVARSWMCKVLHMPKVHHKNMAAYF